MEIDWYGRGMQYVHFNRGCSREPSNGGSDACVDLTEIIGGTLKSKLCVGKSCEPTNGPCNKELSVADQFLPSSKFHFLPVKPETDKIDDIFQATE